MASPWKFLSRFLPRGREQKQGDVKVAHAKPDVLAITGPDATVSEEGLASANPPLADAELPRAALSDPVSVEPEPVGSSVNEVNHTQEDVAGIVAGGSALTDDSDLAVIPAPAAEHLHPPTEGKSDKQRPRAKKPEPVVVTPQASLGVDTASDETMSLDDEIKILRGQLAAKLQLQNAQLKKMLERFDR